MTFHLHCLFFSPSPDFHLYANTTFTGSDLCLAFMVIEHWGFLTCHTYCDKGHPFRERIAIRENEFCKSRERDAIRANESERTSSGLAQQPLPLRSWNLQVSCMLILISSSLQFYSLIDLYMLRSRESLKIKSAFPLYMTNMVMS